MEAHASGRTRGLLFVVVLFLLQPTARGFSGSPMVTETYLSAGTQDSDQSAELSSSRTVIKEGTARFGYSSTSAVSDPSPSVSKRQSHTATDQSSSTKVTESWTTQNRLDTSTELVDFSPALSINTVSEWEDPSTTANITNAYTVAEEWQPAAEYRTVRELTVTKLTEQDHTDKDTTESGSSTFQKERMEQDTTESGSNTFKQERTEQDTAESGSNTFKQERTEQDTAESGSNTFKQQQTDQDTTESGSNTFKQQQTDQDTTESGSNTKQQHADQDTTESGSNTFMTEHTDQDTTESGSNTFKQERTEQDTAESGSNTFKQERTEQDTAESGSNTFKQQQTDQDTTESGSNTFKQQQTDQDTTESGSNTKQQHADQDTTESGSNTFMTEHTDQDTTESGSNTFMKEHTEQDTTESGSNTFMKEHTEQDTTESGSNTKQQHTDQDTTESGSNTFKQQQTDQDTTEFGLNMDSTYISTTLSRAGERTLLSITSNSTSPYAEDISFSSSETAPRSVTGLVEKTEGTQHIEYTEDTKSGHSETMSADVPTNATQKDVFEYSESPERHQSQSHTGQPTTTGSDFESKTTSNPSSTPPLTVINSSDSEMDTTDSSSTNQSFYTDSSSTSSFIPPVNTHNNVSQQDGETTETSIGPVSTNTGKKIDEPKTFIEETTISGLTTAPSTLWEMTTSMYESKSTQQNFVSQTDSPPDPTDLLSTATGPLTNKPPFTENNTHKAITVPVSSTTLDSTCTTAALTTHQHQASTIDEVHSTPQTTLSATETPKKTTATTEQHHPTTGTATSTLSADSSQFISGATDVSTLHFETSTATPGSTTAHSQHTTASYNKVTPTISTAVITTEKRTKTEATTTQMLVTLSPTPGHMCPSHICSNGGKCVLTLGGYRCECLPAWRGENCTEDVDECMSSPCPQDSVCVNTRGSFSCDCALGYDLQDGRSCTQTRTFLGVFSRNSSLHDSHREILQLLNASLSNLHGYRRSTLQHLNGLNILAVNMFSMSANVTSVDIFGRIQTSVRNCNKQQSLCSLKHQHQLTYQMKSLCSAQKNRCDTQYAECNDSDGTPYCQCHEGYFKKNPEDSTCRDCGDGFKLVNGTCMGCPFGFGGFNCNNFYGLIAKVVSPAAGGLLLVVIIALIVTCCNKDKNDINKIIFKSGDLQMSPYGDFPKSSRVSMEWGRETIEMQENGSTKNLLQMTDIYYSPALRNADLDRNGLYPFSGLPGSRHSCIYPAQWNPSFISDDSRRRDYF